MTIVSVSIPEKLLEELDNSIKERGFASRSETIRHALRSFVAEHRSLKELEGEIVATITVIYGKAAKNNQMLSAQHEYGNIISTFLHSHVDENNCLEGMVVRGDAGTIRRLVDAMKANEQIAQVKMAVLGKPK